MGHDCSRRRRIAAAALLLLLLVLPARAAEVRVGDIVVGDAWGRASVGTGAAALFLTVRNEGTAADRLVGVATPAAAQAMLHVSSMEGGVARMRHADSVEIPAGQTVTLQPMGAHIMLVGLAAPLKAGDVVPVELTFATAGRMRIEARIGALGASGPAPDPPEAFTND